MDTLTHILDKYKPKTEGKFSVSIVGDRMTFFPQLFKELGYTVGAEIGVEEGIFSEALIKGNDRLKLYCVDPWEAYAGYREHTSQSKLDSFFAATHDRLSHYNCTIIDDFSENAHKLIPDASLDFIYIDGNHEFFHIAQDLHYWVPKVKRGGIVAGHDYRRNSGRYVNDTKDVIPSYCYAKKINPLIILKDSPGASSWFFVKG